MQVDSALSAAQSILYPKGLDNVVAASRVQHAATVEAAHEARDAYLKKVYVIPSFLAHPCLHVTGLAIASAMATTAAHQCPHCED